MCTALRKMTFERHFFSFERNFNNDKMLWLTGLHAVTQMLKATSIHLQSTCQIVFSTFFRSRWFFFNAKKICATSEKKWTPLILCHVWQKLLSLPFGHSLCKRTSIRDRKNYLCRRLAFRSGVMRAGVRRARGCPRDLHVFTMLFDDFTRDYCQGSRNTQIV